MNNSQPEITVVICTYNRASQLEKGLEAWANQSADTTSFEILVVDNGSTDATPDVYKKISGRYPSVQWRYVSTPIPSLPKARNLGISEAKGKIIAFVDDDAIAGENYIENLLENIKRFPEFSAFGGPVFPLYEGGKEPVWMSSWLQRIYSLVHLGNVYREFRPKYPVGANMIFRKKIFERYGHFDVETNRSDDKQFFYKIRRAGEKVLYFPNVRVRHFIDKNRQTRDYVIRTSYLNGVADRKMLRHLPHPGFLFWKRFVDLIFKIGASLVLWLYYTLRGKGIKGKYLFLSMWYTFMGFLKGK